MVEASSDGQPLTILVVHDCDGNVGLVLVDDDGDDAGSLWLPVPAAQDLAACLALVADHAVGDLFGWNEDGE